MPNTLNKDRNKNPEDNSIRVAREILNCTQQSDRRHRLQQLTEGYSSGGTGGDHGTNGNTDERSAIAKSIKGEVDRKSPRKAKGDRRNKRRIGKLVYAKGESGRKGKDQRGSECRRNLSVG